MTDTQATVLALRMWRSLLATQELLSAYLGVRLGLYEVLAAAGPATPGKLAERAAIAPRYAREWLEQQAVTGLLTVDAVDAPADERVYTLPSGHAQVLTVSDHPMSMAALAVLPLGGVAAALPRLLAAYRTGDGVPDEVYGPDWRDGHSGANRSVFAHDLPRWLAAYLPDVHAQLSVPGCRAVDVACGAGWSSLALARTYPALRVDGIDLDAEAVAQARRHAEEAGLGERVCFAVRDAAEPDPAGGYDLVCLFDALHEMSRPVEVLRACRALRAAHGTVLLMDAKVAPTFTAPGDEVERFQYGTSVLHCLPASRTGPDCGGTGTVLRPDAVRALATEAGFAAVMVLPVDDRFHRLYRLVG
jgi:SAM-dependent methyltransferase